MPLGMGLNKLVHWYQKKIGTYDKQQWERTIEQHILDGLTHVPMRTAKLKTELIDVDLVRGSSFPKAKPKHGLSTVACLAFQRLLFLPFYNKWWIEQTSFRIFALFLLLYSLQAVNMILYYMFTHRENELEIVSMSEVLVPVVMMFVLCIVHSHIVSTHSGPPLKYNQSKLRIPRRSRREARCRNGKSRSRQSLRMHKDSKSSQDMASEKASTGSEEVFTSVRFAKKVLIENSSTVGQSTKESAQLVYEKESIKKDTISTNEESSNPANESSANREQPDHMAEERVANIHQDDDGFESLNGNVSSDNDKVGGRIQAQRNRSRAGTTRQTKDRTSWSEDSTSQQISLPSKRSAPNPLKNDGNFTDSKSNLNSIKDKDAPSKIMGSRETRQQCESEEEGECEEATTHHLTEATTSATEWMGVTTNSDDCSYSSELGESDLPSETNLNYGEFVEHPFSWEFELPPSILLNSTCTSSDRVSCTIWTRRDIKKAELSVLDISSAIIARVESMPESMNYFYGGLILSISLCLIPSIKRLSDHIGSDNVSNASVILLPNDIIQDTYLFNFETYTDVLCKVIGIAFGNTFCERTVVLISMFERFMLSCFLFFLLAVAERTYKQRLLYAKLFSHLTSSRRARKSDLPHFRLNKVRNIKTWLSVRSYLKRRGPQRSVDVIVSAVFIVTLLLLSFVSLELIKDLESLHSRYNVEALFWSFSLGIFILRFMTLGTKINKKYRNLSVLITEQINLYLQIEQKPHKKEELMVANSVLKLAADLIKVNFLLTQFTALVLAGILRSRLSPATVTPGTRHVYGLTIGLALGYFCFGRQAVHLVGLPAICYIAIRIQNPYNVQRVVLAIALIYLSCIHLHRQMYDYGSYKLDITGPLMVITQKVTSLAYSIHDGLTRREEELTQMQRHQAVKKMPSTLEYFSYIFHFQALMAGPIIFYRDYIDFIYGNHLPGTKSLASFYEKRDQEKEIAVEPSPTLVVVKKVTASLICALIFVTLIPIFPIQRLKDNEFLENTNMFYTIIFLLMTTMLARFKYYHAWLFADAICNNSGLGFNGYDEQGNARWDMTSNVDVYKFETSLTLRDSINSWNKGTNLWLRSLVYERTGRNKVLYTYALSAIWHGFYPGYYLTFAGGALFTIASRSIRRHVRPLFLESRRMKIFYDVLTFVTTRIVMAYITFSFVLLEFVPSIKVYLHLYLLPHLLGLIAILLVPRLGLSRKTRKQSEKTETDFSSNAISNGNAHKTM